MEHDGLHSLDDGNDVLTLKLFPLANSVLGSMVTFKIAISDAYWK